MGVAWPPGDRCLAGPVPHRRSGNPFRHDGEQRDETLQSLQNRSSWALLGVVGRFGAVEQRRSKLGLIAREGGPDRLVDVAQVALGGRQQAGYGPARGTGHDERARVQVRGVREQLAKATRIGAQRNRRVGWAETAQLLALHAATVPLPAWLGECGELPAADSAISVAPGIAEALVATAMGLFAAIPAVIAYNHFSSHSERMINRYEIFQHSILYFRYK